MIFNIKIRVGEGISTYDKVIETNPQYSAVYQIGKLPGEY